MKLRELGIPLDWDMTLEPRTDQLEDLAELLKWDKSANYSQVGTGKSLVAYLYIMKKLTQDKRVVVIMPPPLIPQFILNFKKFLPENTYWLARLHEDRTLRHQEMDMWDRVGWPDVLFLSYQLYVKYQGTLSSVKQYKVLVADEAHAISNATTKTFQKVFMHVYSKNLDLLVMTATPTTTELQTAYGQIRLRIPAAYASLSQFERMHCEYAQKDIGRNGKQAKQIVGYKAIDVINSNLMRQAVRRRARDVLSLDAPTVIDHSVVLSRDHSELYRSLLESWMLEMGDEVLVARNAQALRQMALQIITNVAKYTDQNIYDEPLENLLAIIDKIDMTKTKLLVFCNFQDTVVKLNKALRKYNPALVYGASNTQKEVAKLLEDDTCRIGILNFYSGGAGFNLQGVAHTIVVYEAIGSPGMTEQAIGRVHRGGQVDPVVVWIFRYARTISKKLFDKNFHRAQDIKQSLSDTECFVDFLTDREPTNLKEDLGL